MPISRSCLLPGEPTLGGGLTSSAGTADVRQVFEQAKNGLKLTGRYVASGPRPECANR